MPEAIALPQKRVLGDATNTNPRGTVQSPPGMKKRKIDAEPAAAAVKPSPRTQNGAAQRKVGGSSQPQKKPVRGGSAGEVDAGYQWVEGE